MESIMYSEVSEVEGRQGNSVSNIIGAHNSSDLPDLTWPDLVIHSSSCGGAEWSPWPSSLSVIFRQNLNKSGGPLSCVYVFCFGLFIGGRVTVFVALGHTTTDDIEVLSYKAMESSW